MSTPPTISVSFPNAIYNTNTSTLGGDVTGPITANIVSSIQGTIVNGVSGTAGSAVVLSTNPNITGGTWTNANLVNPSLGAFTGSSLTLTGTNVVLAAGGSYPAAINSFYFLNTSATGSVNLLLGVGTYPGLSGQAGMKYSPLGTYCYVGVLGGSDVSTPVKIYAGGTQSLLCATTGVQVYGTTTLVGIVGIGTAPAPGYGVWLQQTINNANPVGVLNSTILQPTAINQICYGNASTLTVATGTFTGQTVYVVNLNTPTVTGSGTITGGYMLNIGAPAAGMTGAVNVTSGAVNLGTGLTTVGTLSAVATTQSVYVASTGTASNTVVNIATVANGTSTVQSTLQIVGNVPGGNYATYMNFGNTYTGNTSGAFIGFGSGTLIFATGGAFTGSGTVALTINASQQVLFQDATLHRTNVTLTNSAGASAGTLTNAPAVGNPTKWAPVNDNGTTRYVPMW